MEKDTESCLQPIMEAATSYSSGKMLETVEMRFASKEEAKKHWSTIRRSVDLILLPLYTGKRNARIRIRCIPPEI